MTNKPYSIKIAPRAHQHFQTLSVKQQKKIIQFLEALAINPRPPGSKKIEGLSGLYFEQLETVKLIYRIENVDIVLLSLKF